MKTLAATEITTSALDTHNCNSTKVDLRVLPYPLVTDCATSLLACKDEHDCKAFAALAAQSALLGRVLTKGRTSGGPVSFYATCWLLVRHLPDLDGVRVVASQIGRQHV